MAAIIKIVPVISPNIYGHEGALYDNGLNLHLSHFYLALLRILYFGIEFTFDDFVIWTDSDDGPLKI